MNKNILPILAFMFIVTSAGTMEAMLSNAPTRYQSRQDLETRKLEMRRDLKDLSRSVQEDVSSENLHRVKERVKAIYTIAAIHDPQMAKRAQTLINVIDGKLRYQMEVE